MKISGFSFVRNGFDYGVPFLESIRSILPVCDEFIVAVGDSQDGTREAIQQLDASKIKIVDTVWDKDLREAGKIFAKQANLALDEVTGDWAFHLQADEVIHEKDLHLIREAVELYDSDKEVEGFILPFLHFWGGYDHIRTSRRVHRYEVRLFRNNLGVRSYRDSQGFRKYSSKAAYGAGTDKGSKLAVRKINAPIYHYNGIRPPEAFRKKAEVMRSFYRDADEEIARELAEQEYGMDSVDRVEKFTGTHPAVMMDKVLAQDWVYKKGKGEWKLKDRIMQPLEDMLGFKIGEYRNYRLLR